MGDNEQSNKLIFICPNCGSHDSEFETYLEKVLKESSSLKASQKEVVCMSCAAHFTIGDRQIKVEGIKSDEVKEVAAYLMKQADEFEKNEKDFQRKIKLQKELTNDKIKQLFVVGGFWIGAFLGIG